MSKQDTQSLLLSHPGWLVVAVLLAFFVNLGGVPLFDVDEGAFAEATREMLESGNFVATYLNGEPRYDKPIFSYWMQALSVNLFDLHEWSLRLPSAIAASLWLVATFRFTRKMTDLTTAKMAALLFTNVLWITLIGRAAIADAWLNLFLCLTLFDIYSYSRTPENVLIWRVFLWMALAVLTKGPVAMAIPFLVSGLFFFFEQKLALWWRALIDPVGWLVFVLVLSPWLYLVYQDQGMDFFRQFLLIHNVDRFTDTREGHGGGPLYYLLVLPLIILPFSGVLVALARRFRQLPGTPLSRFLLLWFGMVFVLVSLSQTKLPHYVLYGTTPLIVLFALHRQLLFRSRWLLLAPAVFFLLMLLLPWLVQVAAGNTENLYVRALLAQGTDVFDVHYLLCAALTLVIFIAISVRWRTDLVSVLVLAGMLQSVFVFNVLMERLADLQQRPVREAALLSRQLDKPVVSWGIDMPSFSVYRQAVTESRLPRPGELVFTREDKLLSLKKELGNPSVRTWYQQGGIVLAEFGDAG